MLNPIDVNNGILVLYKHEPKVINNKDTWHVQQELNNYQGFPLNESILVTNGFISIQNKNRMRYRKGKFIIEVVSINKGELLLHSSTGFNLEFVHQLQNLYFGLTQEKLEINIKTTQPN